MRIDIHTLEKTYGAFTLSVPELSIASGESVGLVGNNGAGKTTMLRLVLDLIAAERGTVSIGGRDVCREPIWKERTGSYLDSSFLIDFLTADEYLTFVAEAYGYDSHEVGRLIEPYQVFYNEEPFGRTTRYLRELSTGNRKKMGLIAAMFIKPDVLVLDEPFANLDPRAQILFKQLLLALRTDHGTTVLISSHDLVHVTEVCDRILLLDDGRIIRDTSRSETTYDELRQFFVETAPPTG